MNCGLQIVVYIFSSTPQLSAARSPIIQWIKSEGRFCLAPSIKHTLWCAQFFSSVILWLYHSQSNLNICARGTVSVHAHKQRSLSPQSHTFFALNSSDKSDSVTLKWKTSYTNWTHKELDHINTKRQGLCIEYTRATLHTFAVCVCVVVRNRVRYVKCRSRVCPSARTCVCIYWKRQPCRQRIGTAVAAVSCSRKLAET